MGRAHGHDLLFADVDSREIHLALSRLPKEVQDALRTRNKERSEKLKAQLIQRTRAPYAAIPPEAALVAKAIYVRRDRFVRVDIGGPKQVGRKSRPATGGRKRGAAAGQLLFGAEFGSSGEAKDRSGRNMGKRFVVAHKESGYWIKPTFDDFSDTVYREWLADVRKLIEGKNHG